MDFAKALTFVFDDPRWKEKIAWGTGLVLISSFLSIVIIGILGFFILAGYGIRLLQNVRDGEEFPLPEWNEWVGDFSRGLKLVVVGLVYGLPMMLFAIPLGMGAAIADSGGAGEFFGVTLLLCGSCFMILYGLFVFLASPGFSIAFATDERITSGLQFTNIWHWTRDNIGSVLVAILIVMVAQFAFGLVASIVGMILCGVGVFITAPLSILAYILYQNHIFGQLAYEHAYGGIGGPGTSLDPMVPAVSADEEVLTEIKVGETPTEEIPEDVDETLEEQVDELDDKLDDEEDKTA